MFIINKNTIFFFALYYEFIVKIVKNIDTSHNKNINEKKNIT